MWNQHHIFSVHFISSLVASEFHCACQSFLRYHLTQNTSLGWILNLSDIFSIFCNIFSSSYVQKVNPNQILSNFKAENYWKILLELLSVQYILSYWECGSYFNHLKIMVNLQIWIINDFIEIRNVLMDAGLTNFRFNGLNLE